MTRVRRVLEVLRRRGVRYPFYLVKGWLLPRVAWFVLLRSPISGLLRRVVVRLTPLPRVPAHRTVEADRFVQAGGWLPAETLAAVQESQSLNKKESGDGGTVVLGRIDNDGRLLPLLGPVPDFESVSDDEFVTRYRYGVDLVVEGGRVLVRKDYRGDRAGFLREWASLSQLEGESGPAVHRVDETRHLLLKALLPGPTLRQLLVDLGANILSVDTAVDPEILQHEGTARLEAVWARGRKTFDALPAGMIDAVERQMESVHRRGVTGFSLTYGNVVITTPDDEPRFLDFDSAETHSRASGIRFALARDRDRQLFARIYGREVTTEASAREMLRSVATPYSPADLGGGLATKGFWSVDSGTGRWDYLNGPVLRDLLGGCRVLDLGSFNALMPLMMLADGARQVVALEKSPEMIPVGMKLRKLFEWRDQRPYDLDLRCADMRAVLEGEWGRFDLVTAFCSLYYLEEDDMARVVARAAELAPIMVLQAKTDTRSSAADGKAVKSSVPFLRRLLESHGFADVEVVAPAGFTRPLLIGRK